MELQDRLFSENTGEVLYSVAMTEEEYDLFSEFSSLEQREFNSKAAKALKDKYLKMAAGDLNIPIYKSKGFKTVEIDPRTWKKSIRDELKSEFNGFDNKTRKHKSLTLTEDPLTDLDRFNSSISDRSSRWSASEYQPFSNKSKKFYKNANLEHYDHGVKARYRGDGNIDRILVERAKAERLRSKTK